jgi:two-component system response regulator YesN
VKNHWFYNRLLVSYIPIIFSVCTVLVILLVIGFNQLSREAAKKESMVIAQYIMAAIDHELVEIEQIIDTEILNKSHFMRLFHLNPTTSSYQDIYELSVKLRETRFKYPAIDSIYVYRYADKTVQSMNGAVSLDRFGDQTFVQYAIALNNIDEISWSKIRPFQEFKGQNPSEVISLIRSIPIMTQAGGVIVVNVGTEYLRNIVSHLTDLNNTFISVKDSAGNNLLEAGSDNVKVDAVYESKDSGYTIRLGFREGVLYGIINTITVIYVIIGILVLLLGLIWAIYTTKQTYKPIHSIMSKLGSFSGNVKLQYRKERDNNEFGFVEQTLERLIERSTQFEQQQKENAVFKQRMFYAELREGFYKGTTVEVDNQLIDFGWHADSEGFMMAIVEIDRFDEFTEKFNERDQSLLKFAINTVFVEISQASHHPQPWADWLSSNQIALLYPVNRDGHGSYEAVTKDLAQAVGWIDNHLKTTVSIGIGSPAWKAEYICISYEEALQMLKFKFALGNNRIIGHWEVDRMDRTGYMLMLTPARELVRSFCLAKSDWLTQFDVWFKGVSEWIAPKEDIDRLMYSLIYYFRLEVSQFSGELSELWRQEYDSRLEHCVQYGRSLNDIGRRLREFLIEVDGRLAEFRERSRYSTAMQEIRDYIDVHYSDSDLSLELLSTRFELNSKTLSRLFKEQFGVNFVDYLIRTRIQQSKPLLLESDDTIQDISRKVGYQNSLSFTRAFKKIEGITPLDHRRTELV